MITPLEPTAIAGLDVAINEFEVATADTASDDTYALKHLLGRVREMLNMDVAFVAEFVNGRRVFREVAAGAADSKVVVGQSDPLEETYCQRIVDGRLPLAIPDTSVNPESARLAVTEALDIGAYLSAPVVLQNGEVYGTVCCLRHGTAPELGVKQVQALCAVARMVSANIDRNRTT